MLKCMTSSCFVSDLNELFSGRPWIQTSESFHQQRTKKSTLKNGWLGKRNVNREKEKEKEKQFAGEKCVTPEPFYVKWLQLMKHDSELADSPARLLLPPVCSSISPGGVNLQVTAPSNSWRGSWGHVTAASGPISDRRALSIPEHPRIVWYLITLIHPLPFSQLHLHDSLTFVLRRSSPSPSGAGWDNDERLWISSNYDVLSQNLAALIRYQTTAAAYRYFTVANTKNSVSLV